MSRGRAWGNALGGWRLQGRGSGGKFLKKGTGSVSSYRPSRAQLATQQRQQAAKKAQRRTRNKKIAKGVAIVGGTAVVAGGAYYAAKKINAHQVNTFESRQGARYAKNAAGYSRSGAPGDSLSQATSIKAGNFPQVRMSPMAPLGLKGFSQAGAANHHVSTLLPPVGFSQNTRRPAVYRHTGEALQQTMPANTAGKELLLRSDVTKAGRSFNARKTNWKKKGKAAAAAAAAQNPSAATTVKPKAPSGQMTIDDIMPVRPATGTGSPNTISNDAKKAATGGGQAKKGSAAPPANAPRPTADADDTKLVGSNMVGTDADGNTISIPVSKLKPKGASKASNQPSPDEAVLKIDPSTVVKFNPDGYKGDSDRPVITFDEKGIKSLLRKNKGMKKKDIEAAAILGGMEPHAAKRLADEAARVRTNEKAKARRAVNPATGQRMSRQEHNASSLSGAVVSRTMDDSVRIAKIADKMASGKMVPQADRISSAYSVLQDLGVNQLGSAALRKNSRDDRYSGSERKAMRDYALWLDQKTAMQKKES